MKVFDIEVDIGITKFVIVFRKNTIESLFCKNIMKCTRLNIDINLGVSIFTGEKDAINWNFRRRFRVTGWRYRKMDWISVVRAGTSCKNRLVKKSDSLPLTYLIWFGLGEHDSLRICSQLRLYIAAFAHLLLSTVMMANVPVIWAL